MNSRVARSRAAQGAWSELPIADRLGIVRSFRALLATEGVGLAAAIRRPGRDEAGSLTAEVLPLAEACRFLEREAPYLLEPRALGRRGRPLWLTGVDSEVRREPLGVVLVIGAHNYPLFLPGVQTLQALAAGNSVVLKPGRGGAAVAQGFAELLRRAGLPDDVLIVLGEEAAEAEAAIGAGVDKILLTGSAATGQRVLAQAASTLTPAALELSGCDAVFVRADADVPMAARAIRFGLMLNGGATCIGPRRVFVHREIAEAFEEQLVDQLGRVDGVELEPTVAADLKDLMADAEHRGARLPLGPCREGELQPPVVIAAAHPEMNALKADIFAPLVSLVVVDGDDEALEAAAKCPYALGAAIFGSAAAARRLAGRINAGTVVVNDLIVPTADPRIPFGGRGRSGYGVTRGAEGLLELTHIKTVLVRSGSFRPHYEPTTAATSRGFQALLTLVHGRGLKQRFGGILRLLRGGGEESSVRDSAPPVPPTSNSPIEGTKP